MRAARTGDDGARQRLILRYMPLARRLAGRYRGPAEGFEDLVQVASLGLIGAVDRFDPDRGTSFSSFAVPTILGELKRHFRNTAWSAHVPRRAQELAVRIDRAVREYAGGAGRRPTVPELAEHLQLDLEEVLTGLEASGAHHASSLDAPVSAAEEEEREPLGERIGAGDERYDLVDARVTLETEVRRLPQRERQAVILRSRRLKQAEIGHRLGCSQMQVSRLLRRASDRLRAAGALG